MSKVLVVEDSPTQREFIKELLQEMKLQVDFAFDGVEALSMVVREVPDLVVLDIVMPGLNGYEVCRRIRANNLTREVAVVMYSSKSEEWDFYWGSKQGADAYVSKLCRPQDFINTVKQLLRKTTRDRGVESVKRVEQEPEQIAQINQLYSNLRVYQKFMANSLTWGNKRDLGIIVEQIKTQIHELTMSV